MISLLIHFFIKNKQDTNSDDVRRQYGVLSGAAGIFFNFLLFTIKLSAGIFSRSIAITADAFNNLSDAASSIITLIGFKMAGQEPDSDHPFGHGRIEYISGLIISMLIIIMAVELVRSSFLKILHPEELLFHPVVIGILIISILVKLYMYFYNKKLAGLIQSSTLHATATDSLSDAASTSVVLASTLISWLTRLPFHIDGWCGMLVGAVILFAGVNAAKDTVSPLLGQAPDPDLVKKIHALVSEYKDIIGIHDLIIHDYGPGRRMVSLHAEVSSSGSITALHDIIDTIEKRLQSELSCNAVIHMDPVKQHDRETIKYKTLTEQILKEIHPSITLHDFRISRPKNPKSKNKKRQSPTYLIFDVGVPYHTLSMSKEALHAEIIKRMEEKIPHYLPVIQIDYL